MTDAIELNISGIKCDACDYRDDNVKVEDYDDWLNKPCPVCGANLLTEADLNNVKMIMELTKLMNSLSPQRDEDEEIVTMSVEMNGTGKIDLNIKE